MYLMIHIISACNLNDPFGSMLLNIWHSNDLIMNISLSSFTLNLGPAAWLWSWSRGGTFGGSRGAGAALEILRVLI